MLSCDSRVEVWAGQPQISVNFYSCSEDLSLEDATDFQILIGSAKLNCFNQRETERVSLTSLASTIKKSKKSKFFRKRLKFWYCLLWGIRNLMIKKIVFEP